MTDVMQADPLMGGGDLTPEIAYGAQQSLMPLLLKKVLEDDSADFGSYNPAGYYIPNSPERVQGKRAQRQQALDMLRGLMQDVRGSGGGGLGGLNPNKVYQTTPGMVLKRWNPQTGQFEAAPGDSSTPYGPKVANEQEIIHNPDGSVTIRDLRDSPEYTSQIETAKTMPDTVLKATQGFQAEEERLAKLHTVSRKIYDVMQNPEVRSKFGALGGIKEQITAIGQSLFPEDPDGGLSRAQEIMSEMLDAGMGRAKELAPVSNVDLQSALQAAAGGQSLSPDSLRSLALHNMGQTKRQYDRIARKRELLAKHSIDPELVNVFGRTQELPPLPEGMTQDPLTGDVLPGTLSMPTPASGVPSFEGWLRAKGHIQ